MKTRITVLCEEEVYEKMKVIAAYKKRSISSLTIEYYNGIIKKWEKEYGAIKFVDSE